MKPNFAALLAACCALTSAANNVSLHTHQNITLFQPLFPKHTNSTPRYQNLTGVTVNPLVKALHNLDTPSDLHRRQSGDNGLPIGMCAPGTPCSNGACCSSTGICGYSPDECGTGACLSNCDAKAECGQYAASGKEMCPLNVCCSHFGFCGTTDDFCKTDGENSCQKGFGSCGPANTPSCGGSSATSDTDIMHRSSTRKCDARDPEDLDLTGITHLNFGESINQFFLSTYSAKTP
jgi:chitinase